MEHAQRELSAFEQVRISSWRVGKAVWLWTILVACIAIVPRCAGLADFFTVDEAYHWIGRVRMFSAALAAHQWAKTNLTGHPGVTTMWLGSLGRLLAHQMGVPDEHSALGPTAAYLAMLRLPLAAVNGLTVAAAYLLLRRLLRPGVALLAALLWAAAPFVIAFDRLLHVDGLATSFIALSLLLLLVATEAARRAAADRRGYLLGGRLALVGSGVCAGLAVASKSPGLILLPWSGLTLLAAAIGDARQRSGAATWRATIRDRRAEVAGRTCASYAIWLACAALTLFVVWPAMWVGPRAAFGSIISEMIDNGGAPHASGNYFLGAAVPDPGWDFYPVVVALRSTPPTLIGLLALPLILRRRGARPEERRALVALAGFALLFGLGVGFAAKKFDRYLLPAWPALEILAAAGLYALGRALVDLAARRAGAVRIGAWAGRAAQLAVVAVLLAINLWYHPYYMSYYNPLLGGGAAAEDAILVGWGEGLDQIGAWLQTRPDLARGPVLSWIPPTLQPFVPRAVQVLDIRDRTITMRSPAPNYAVLYARGAWRDETPIPEAYIRRTPPLFTLRSHGIAYATVHQLPRPYDTAVNARFGDGLGLRGYAQERVGSTLTITPSWDVQRDQPGGLFLFLHVLAPDGRRVAQIDTPIDEGMFAQWQAGQQFGSPLALALPPDLPAGEYRVALGVYRPADGARLALSGAAALDEAADGPNALLLTTIAVPPRQ